MTSEVPRQRSRRTGQPSERESAGGGFRPSGAGDGGTARGSLRSGPDVVTVLTVYLVLLCAVPSSLSFSALGSAVGRPATAWALIATLWWVWSKVQRPAPSSSRRRNPVRLMVALLVGVLLVSYAWAMVRGLPIDEISPADNGLIRMVSWVGIVVIAADGFGTPGRFRVLMRRLALAGTLLACLGIAQFITGQSLLDWISVPGMSSSNGDLSSLDLRGGFNRASATAMHPLEYGVALCVSFPIALSLAFEDRTRSALARWAPVVIIGVASSLAVSRSTLIGVAITLIVLFPTWTMATRIRFAAIATAALLGVAVAVPGLSGTLRGLFTGIGTDSSTVSRVDGFASAIEFIQRFPVIGKGFGTFLPSYHILDNQLLLLTIELGVVGLVTFLGLVVAAAWSAHRAERLAMNRLDAGLCRAAMAAVIATAIVMAFFDGLSFPISAGLLFLTIGICAGVLATFRESVTMAVASAD